MTLVLKAEVRNLVHRAAPSQWRRSSGQRKANSRSFPWVATHEAHHWMFFEERETVTGSMHVRPPSIWHVNNWTCFMSAWTQKSFSFSFFYLSYCWERPHGWKFPSGRSVIWKHAQPTTFYLARHRHGCSNALITISLSLLQIWIWSWSCGFVDHFNCSRC